MLVVGGGIHGAAVAWTASLAGLSVALVERDDFAGATSAQSQKIIHGGLRYLQSLNIGRSLESIRDRARWFRIAPHLAHPMACVIPLSGFGMRGPEAMGAGLLLYRLLSAREPASPDPVRRLPRPRVLGRAALRDRVPALPLGGVRGGALWFDGCVHHTERLVVSLIRSACRGRAVAANYVEAASLTIRNGCVAGVEAVDRIGGGRFDIRAGWVVDCSGPWEGRLGRPAARPHRHVGGINLVTRPIHPEAVAAGVRVPSAGGSRFYFVSPWRGNSIVGTEWFRHEGPPGEFRPTEAMIGRYLDDFNRAWPGIGLTRGDVRHVHCGVVPADDRAWDRGEAVPMQEHSRVVDRSADGMTGLLGVEGVKYTTALSVGEAAVGRIVPGFRLPRSCDLPRLAGGEIDDWASFLRDGAAAGIPEEELCDFGTEAVSFARPGGDSVAAQVRHAVEREMALRLADVVLRRTGLAARGCPSDAVLQTAAAAMGGLLGWDSFRMADEVADVKRGFLTV